MVVWGNRGVQVGFTDQRGEICIQRGRAVLVCQPLCPEPACSRAVCRSQLVLHSWCCTVGAAQLVLRSWCCAVGALSDEHMCRYIVCAPLRLLLTPGALRHARCELRVGWFFGSLRATGRRAYRMGHMGTTWVPLGYYLGTTWVAHWNV